jgi:hypothetical protein
LGQYTRSCQLLLYVSKTTAMSSSLGRIAVEVADDQLHIGEPPGGVGETGTPRSAFGV